MLVTGIGFDSHKIVPLGKNDTIDYLAVGGVHVKDNSRFLAHSDGDIVIHALIDALTGVTIGKDIGELFPDKDIKYKDMDSLKMLDLVVQLLPHISVQSVDIVVVINQINIQSIKKQIIEILKIKLSCPVVSVKGKTTEGAFNSEYGYAWVNAAIQIFQ